MCPGKVKGYFSSTKSTENQHQSRQADEESGTFEEADNFLKSWWWLPKPSLKENECWTYAQKQLVPRTPSDHKSLIVLNGHT